MPVYELPEMYASEFKALDSFTQGYIQAMFFTTQSNIPMCEFHSEESQRLISEGQADGDLPHDAGFLDIHPDALADIIKDCAGFQRDCAGWLEQVYESVDYDPERAGMDFWYTRNGHGTGFWDRQIDREAARCLSQMAQELGQVDPWFSDTDEPDSPTGYGYVYHKG